MPASPADPARPAKRPSIAIVGAGISGLTVAFELAKRDLPFTLLEKSSRLGGIIETVREAGFVIECGPDSWVSEKPWARELAIELGLKDEILFSNDDRRRTYLVREGRSPHLLALPRGMHMMVPAELSAMLRSPLFSWKAKLAFLRETMRSRELKQGSLDRRDESVADFVRRHFGSEVTRTIAGPLLAGVFGGDVETLSAQAVMPAFIKMEREHGSLIGALRRRAAKEALPPQPIFSTLVQGLETLTDRLGSALPAQSVRLRQPVTSLGREGDRWRLATPSGHEFYEKVVLAAPAHITGELLAGAGDRGNAMAKLLPQQASSAIIVAFAFHAEKAARIRVPTGFGFLAPTTLHASQSGNPRLLACTFVDQKFIDRAPEGAVLLRAFFGGAAAEALLGEPDERIVRLAAEQLASILQIGGLQAGGALPEPDVTVVRRLPLSLPQYAVGHLERIAELERIRGNGWEIYLTGNAYYGVGIPDLIRDARSTARRIAEEIAQ